MIAHLRGRLFSKQPQQAIVEAAGVGYDVAISVSTYTSLPAEGAEVSLHIHTQVREDTLALYGFIERNDKRIFERLITVSGVGPKLAITIQSGLPADRLVAALRAQDHATLTRIPGVGKKLAERLVVELKDKLEDMAVAAPAVAAAVPAAERQAYSDPQPPGRLFHAVRRKAPPDKLRDSLQSRVPGPPDTPARRRLQTTE